MASQFMFEVEVMRSGTDVWVTAAAFDTVEEAWAFKYEGSQAEADLGRASAVRITSPTKPLRIPWQLHNEDGPQAATQQTISAEDALNILAAARSKGRKDDQRKARFDLIPMRALRSVANVLTFGAEKYGVDNWRLVEDRERRYIAAAFRHIVAHALGEKTDPETGEPHLAHAACCVLFLLEEAAS